MIDILDGQEKGQKIVTKIDKKWQLLWHLVAFLIKSVTLIFKLYVTFVTFQKCTWKGLAINKRSCTKWI